LKRKKRSLSRPIYQRHYFFRRKYGFSSGASIYPLSRAFLLLVNAKIYYNCSEKVVKEKIKGALFIYSLIIYKEEKMSRWPSITHLRTAAKGSKERGSERSVVGHGSSNPPREITSRLVVQRLERNREYPCVRGKSVSVLGGGGLQARDSSGFGVVAGRKKEVTAFYSLPISDHLIKSLDR